MKQSNRIVITILIVGLSFAAFAQGGRGTGNYDSKTEVTVKGTIEDVQQYAGRHNWSGTHLLLKTDTGTLPVHVGPSSFLAKQQFSFAKGEEIEVLGSKVTMAQKETLLAREIRKAGKTLVLRNAQGIPEWSGGRAWR
jgi:hypothetical protein